MSNEAGTRHNSYPKPMAPKKPLIAVSQEKIDLEPLRSEKVILPHGTITLDDLRELQAAVFGITPAEMHGEVPKPVDKPKYVLKPHLTERPLKGHEGLEALKKQLEDSSPKRPLRRNHKEKK